MFFRQILHDDLGCASYVLADGRDAVVVDPKWMTVDYIDLLRRRDLRLRHILETHTHADHLSGRGRLGRTTGATIHISAAAHVAFPHRALVDGDAIELGDLRITAVATPGHRPEHLAFAVADRSRGEEPWLLLTGDSLLVGDVARPDLASDPADGAAALYRSLRRLERFGDGVEVWPGHVGGSLCGGAGVSDKTSSTLGYERRTNPYLLVRDEAAFVERALAGLAPQPPHFRDIAARNRGPLVEEAPEARPLWPADVRVLLEQEGGVLFDGRSPDAFDEGHIPGSVNLPVAGAGVGSRAAALVGVETPIGVLAENDRDSRRMVRLLEAAGLRGVRGVVVGGLRSWRSVPLPAEASRSVELGDAARAVAEGAVTLVDVRSRREWDRGHVPGSIHLPVRELGDGTVDALPDGPLAVACAVGNRAALAASVLRLRGKDARRVRGGGVADLLERRVRS